MIKIGLLSDFIFPRYFFTHESELPDPQIATYLTLPVYVRKSGQENEVQIADDGISIQQPTSVSMFLFHLMHNIIARLDVDQSIKDNVTISTMMLCNDYIHADNNPLFPFENIIVPLKRIPEFKVIIDDILEPLLGKFDVPTLCFVKSPILDVCKLALDERTVHQYAPDMKVKKHHLPVILCNIAISNKAALFAHILELCIKSSFGENNHSNVVKKILVSENGLVLDYIITVLKTFHHDPMFTLDFLRFTESSVKFDQEMVAKMNFIKNKKIASDVFFNQFLKAGSSALMSENHNQWTQLSLMMGLIEKQLDGARGSKWPATQKLKPIEDRLRAIMLDMKKDKKKRNLNFEEMLAAARSMYNHKAIEPGKVIEVYLRKNRDWK